MLHTYTFFFIFFTIIIISNLFIWCVIQHYTFNIYLYGHTSEIYTTKTELIRLYYEIYSSLVHRSRRRCFAWTSVNIFLDIFSWYVAYVTSYNNNNVPYNKPKQNIFYTRIRIIIFAITFNNNNNNNSHFPKYIPQPELMLFIYNIYC